MRLYQRPDSQVWWIDASIKGRRYRGSTGETSKRSAKIAADRIINALELKYVLLGGVWTISQAITRWWEDHAKNLRSADVIWSNIENIDRCLDCSMPVTDLTSARLMDFRAMRRGEPAHPKHRTPQGRAAAAAGTIKTVQPPTINRDLSYLQAALKHAKLMHGQPVPDLPWSKIKFKENEPRNRFASHDEFGDLLDRSHPDLSDLILAAVATGLRRGNLRWKWHQIDLRGATLTIARTKGGVPMVIKLSPPVVEMLKRRRITATATAGAVPGSDADVFSWTNFRKRWEALRRDLGMGDFRWHDLRHTFGTWARKAGVDLPTLKDAMAHKDIKTTQRYAHVEADEVDGAFDKVGAQMARSASRPETKSNNII